MKGLSKKAIKILWIILGQLSLILALIGLLLPIMPTVPFVILAAFCFSRGSNRCEQWLLQHRWFGPMIHNWRVHRAIPRRAKWLATCMMLISCISVGLYLPLFWKIVLIVSCGSIFLWLWSLPDS